MKDLHNIFMNLDIKIHIFESSYQHKWLQDKFLSKFSFSFKHKFNKSDHIFRHMIYFKVGHINQDPMDKLLHSHQLKDQNIADQYMLAYKLL